MSDNYFKIKFSENAMCRELGVNDLEWLSLAYQADKILGNGDYQLQANELDKLAQLTSMDGVWQASYWKKSAALMHLVGVNNIRTCLVNQSDKTAATNSSVIYPDAARTNLDENILAAAFKASGAMWTLADWAVLYPNAKIRGVGNTLTQLLHDEREYIRLAKIDQHGDLDITHLQGELLKQWQPQLLIRKNDDYPVNLDYYLAHGHLVSSKIPVALNLADEERVKLLINDEKFRPSVYASINHTDVAALDLEQMRRILFSALDYPGAELQFDDAFILEQARHKQESFPEFIASVKVNPAHLDHRILVYTPFYLRSNPPQAKHGIEISNIPPRGYFHQGDAESIYVLLGASGKVIEVFGDTHYYLSRANSAQINAVNVQRQVIMSVSYLAHGTQVAQSSTEYVEAKSGSLQSGSLAFFDDVFPGMDELASGKSELIAPKLLVDTKAISMSHVQLGKSIGYRNLGFNDGIRMRRLRSDYDTYNTDPIYQYIKNETSGLIDHSYELSLGSAYALFASLYRFDISFGLPPPKKAGFMLKGGMGILNTITIDGNWEATAPYVYGKMLYGFAWYQPSFTTKLILPEFFAAEQSSLGIALALEFEFNPLAFQIYNWNIEAGLAAKLMTPNIIDWTSADFGAQNWYELLAGLKVAYRF